MGSAQSARRIQPGGGSGRAGGPADLSRPPFLPTPPPALPPPSSLLPGGGLRRVRGWAGGAGGGVGGGPPPGRRPAAAGRISTAAVRRDRLRDGWEGRWGRWLGGPRRPLPPSSPEGEGGARGGPTAPSVTAPRQQRSPNPGAEGVRPVAALSPLPALPPAGALPRQGGCPSRGRAGFFLVGAGPPLPRRDRSPTPASPPPPPLPGVWGGPRCGSGRGGLSSVRPGRVAPSGPGGWFFWSSATPSRAKRAHGVSGDVGHPPDPS